MSLTENNPTPVEAKLNAMADRFGLDINNLPDLTDPDNFTIVCREYAETTRREFGKSIHPVDGKTSKPEIYKGEY